MNYLSFKEFVNKYGLKNEATSNVEIKEILKLMNTSCGIYMRDDKFITTSGIVNLHPTKGTHWVMFTQSASVMYKPKLFRFIWLSTTTKYNKTN